MIRLQTLYKKNVRKRFFYKVVKIFRFLSFRDFGRKSLKLKKNPSVGFKTNICTIICTKFIVQMSPTLCKCTLIISSATEEDRCITVEFLRVTKCLVTSLGANSSKKLFYSRWVRCMGWDSWDESTISLYP